MGHEFETTDAVEVPATPEQVWDAIATGPGINSWFMGRNEVEPGAKGAVQLAFGDYAPRSAITAWDPPHHFRHDVPGGPDGRFIAYEFLIEGRDSGSTVLRVVTSGFLPGDDWAEEFEAMTQGGALFFATLRTYLCHFAGRYATPVTVFGPAVDDWTAAWPRLYRAMGLADAVSPGDHVAFDVPGVGRIDGEIYHVNAQTIGIRTGGAMYRFLQGLHGPMVAGHHLFDRSDPAEDAWKAWLDTTILKGHTS